MQHQREPHRGESGRHDQQRDAVASISANFAQIGLPNGPADVRDLWAHADLGTFSGNYTAMNVPSHGIAMLRVAQ